jgi:EpsI family protein
MVYFRAVIRAAGFGIEDPQTAFHPETRRGWRMSRRLRVLILCLVLIFFCRVCLIGSTDIPPRKPLETFPSQLGAWSLVESNQLSPSVLQTLRADDYLSRWYQHQTGTQVELFVAYYRTQRAGESMHSPRNCLPGSGWQPVVIDRIGADLGTGKPEIVNRYLLEKDGKRTLVIYWYQAHGRIIADEYLGKIWLVWDAIRLHRHDGGIVRYSVVLDSGASEELATKRVLQLAHAVSQSLPDFLPN